MKKLMLGTTALVAASALTVGTAGAAEKMKLGMGGYMQSSFVLTDYDDDETTGGLEQHNTRVQQEGEVIFSASTTLDNGIQFGVNIQLEAREESDQVDETYVYASGSFGRVNLGSEDSAPYLMHYAAPSPVPAWGVHSANSDVVGHGLSTSPNEIGDADKITYFTPKFSGFQLGASYTPDADCETASFGAGCGPYNILAASEGAGGEEGTAWSIAANYVNTFNDVMVAVSLGYQTIEWDNSTGSDFDVEELAIGANVGFAGFTVGASYKNTENDGGTDGTDRDEWNAGVTYGMGPWKVGIQYGTAELDSSGVTDGEEIHGVVVGGQYTLGPGVTVFGAVQFWDIDDDFSSSATQEDGDSNVYVIGTALSF